MTNPGTSVQAYYGSNARRSAEFETGGSSDNGVDWYFTGNVFGEDGWRDDSPSRVGQLSASWAGATRDSSVSLTGSYADTSLNGNGLQEQRFLARDYASVYTKPDTTKNQALFLNLLGQRGVGDDVTLSGNAYYRNIRTSTLNGDINDDSLERERVPAHRRGAGRAGGGRVQRISDQRRERGEHTVSFLALHRQRAAQRRAQREVQRVAQSQRTRGSRITGRRRRRTSTADLAGNRNQFTRRRRVRRERRALHAVDAVRVPQSGSQRHAASTHSPTARRTRKTPTTRASISTGTRRPGASTPPTR